MSSASSGTRGAGYSEDTLTARHSASRYPYQLQFFTFLCKMLFFKVLDSLVSTWAGVTALYLTLRTLARLSALFQCTYLYMCGQAAPLYCTSCMYNCIPSRLTSLALRAVHHPCCHVSHITYHTIIICQSYNIPHYHRHHALIIQYETII